MCDFFDKNTVEKVQESDRIKNIPVVLPSMDLNEFEDHFEALVHMPGIDPAEASVEIDSDVLTIHAMRLVEEEESWETLHREFGPCHFKGKIEIPSNVDKASIEVFYQDGIMRLVFNKSIPSRQKIQIHLN